MTGLSLFGVGHFMTMLAVGVWGALATRPQTPAQIRQRIWQAPLTMASVMWLGTLVGRAGWQLPGVEPLTALSVLAVGLLIALSRGMALVSMVTLVGLYAFFRGMAFVTDLPHAAQPRMDVAMLLVLTAALHVTGMALGHTLRQQFVQRRMLMQQAVGSGVAALGVYTLLHTW